VLLLALCHVRSVSTVQQIRGLPTARGRPACMMATAQKGKARKGKAKPARKPASSGGFGGPRAAKIPTLTLSSGTEVPALAFGTYRTGGEELQRALRSAITAGYRHIDTASCYQNEDVVAAAIAESGIARDKFFITTKLWCTDHGTERTRRAIEASLTALKTDYIDNFLIHAPWQLDVEKPLEEIRELRTQSWLVLEEYHRAGTLRAIGVSNYEPRHIDEILECGTVKPCVNQIEHHAYLTRDEVREYCAEHGILVQAYGSAGAKGLLEDAAVCEIAAAHGRTPAQVSLKYSLQRGMLVLAKSTTEKRIAKNALLFDFELSDEEMAALGGLDKGERSYWDNSNVP